MRHSLIRMDVAEQDTKADTKADVGRAPAKNLKSAANQRPMSWMTGNQREGLCRELTPPDTLVIA